MKWCALAVGLCMALATAAVAQTPSGDDASAQKTLPWRESPGACGPFPEPAPSSMRVGRVIGRGGIQTRSSVPSECTPDEHGCVNDFLGRLTPGDLVAVYKSYKGYACVEAPDRFVRGVGWRERWGWAPQSRIEVEPDRSPPASWWIGSWKDRFGQSLAITRRHGKLYIVGEGWVGDRESGFGGMAEVSGAGLLVWQEGDQVPTYPGGPPCFAKLVRLGNTIVAHTIGCFPAEFSGFFLRQ